MESLIIFAPFWALYLGFAVVGYWCWNRLFFWLPAHSDWRRLARIPGAVILFTPAPAAEGSGHFAPAVFVLLLNLLEGQPIAEESALLWLLSAVCLGLLLQALRQVIARWRQPEAGAAAEEG